MKNEIYVVTDAEGNEAYKCECGAVMGSMYTARSHDRSVCQAPKVWWPPAGKAEEPQFELDRFKTELEEALGKARNEGELSGYNSGLSAAYQLVTEVKARAERAGQHGVANLLEALKGELDTLVLSAAEWLGHEEDED